MYQNWVCRCQGLDVSHQAYPGKDQRRLDIAAARPLQQKPHILVMFEREICA
ncbi:uncharacterized protein RCC_11057 [Ramularia collo-cygni]|uniref:Uncharacterized protein n=1 Tax=Ramularia collo-cygni TaxID=112498 RepID=A0A2D3VN25_9PEZI|nr:uncharacterized protein RCC_11057 [Ramularia collo-cygni]CZT25329.1 uncharacterized protein RCC_11057 [Ramularia collo-cygni]